MPVTIQTLIRQQAFSLRLVAGAEPPSEALRAPLAWVHSSDLEDPTPWLSEGGLLLTDGTQFDPVGEARWAKDYVDRLVERGLAGLGFATEVVHPVIPGRLVAACDERRLPLLEVADRTPFMAIIRFAADMQAREQRERLEWSLDAQRRVARAALQPDGLRAILRELEKQLGCWVALFDAAGHRVPIATRLQAPADLLAEVEGQVRHVLDRGNRGAGRIAGSGTNVTLQTLGQHQRLRGVLVVGSQAPLDPAGHDLVTSVIALASIAVEQSREMEDARRHLRSGLFELMLSGAVDVAARSAEQLWGRLPDPPIRLSVPAETLAPGTLDAELELLAERSRGRVFFARHGESLVAITRHDDTAELRKVWQRQGVAVGTSTPSNWHEVEEALLEAKRAAARAGRARPFVSFENLVEEGILGMLEAAGGHTVARQMLRPLAQRPAPERAMLLGTVRVWLEHNCAWDPAARQLGVHRHTLRNRIGHVGQLLDLDLDRFADRAELWTALQLDRSLSDVDREL